MPVEDRFVRGFSLEQNTGKRDGVFVCKITPRPGSFEQRTREEQVTAFDAQAWTDLLVQKEADILKNTRKQDAAEDLEDDTTLDDYLEADAFDRAIAQIRRAMAVGQEAKGLTYRAHKPLDKVFDTFRNERGLNIPQLRTRLTNVVERADPLTVEQFDLAKDYWSEYNGPNDEAAMADYRQIVARDVWWDQFNEFESLGAE